MSRRFLPLSLFVGLAIAGCGGGDDAEPTDPREPPRPATLSISPANSTLTYINQSAAFTATVRDQYGAAINAQVAWTSSDEAVFTVDASGRATATGNGSGTLQATAGTLTATATVRVQQRAAAIRVIAGDGQEALRETKLPEPIVVRLEDRGGFGVAGIEITFAPGAESGSVSAATVTSDADGHGFTEWTLGGKFGAQVLAISAGGIQNRANARATSDTPLPDLAVESLVLSRADLTDLETFSATATIANRGDAASPDSFSVALTVDGAAIAARVASRLEPDGKTTFAFEEVGPLEAGARRLEVVIDAAGTIDEWGKENNRKGESLAVAPQEIVAVGHRSQISARAGDVLLFRIDVDEFSREALNVEVGAGQGDPDLFVNYGWRPDHQYKYRCQSGKNPGDPELCQIKPARAGSYHIAVHAYSTFGPVDLRVTVGGIEVETFDIELVFLQNGTVEQDNAVRAAADKWEAVIGQGLADINMANDPVLAGRCGQGSPAINDVVDDVRMFVAIDSIDGPGRVLARAGPCVWRQSGWILGNDTTIVTGGAVAGFMEFDEDDLLRLASQGTLTATVTHEMGHVLGFGTLWEFADLIEDPSVGGNSNADTHFTGPLARAAFERLGGGRYRGKVIPVESGGEQGQADSHWRESVFENELMTPFLSAGREPLSLVTIESLADMGYSVDPTAAEFYRLPSAPSAAPDSATTIDLSNDILDLPVILYDQKGRKVGVYRPRRR